MNKTRKPLVAARLLHRCLILGLGALQLLRVWAGGPTLWPGAQPDGSMLLCYPPEWEARIYVTSMRADLELWRDLPTLRPPVLLIRGAETDTLWESTARRFQSLLPQAQVVTLPNTTHLLPLETPEVIAGQIVEFFAQL